MNENDLDPVKAEQLQKLVFELVAQETGEGRAYLEECLRETWFATPESLDEFIKTNGCIDEPLEVIAKSYVENT
jgi:hypothetical protein